MIKSTVYCSLEFLVKIYVTKQILIWAKLIFFVSVLLNSMIDHSKASYAWYKYLRPFGSAVEVGFIENQPIMCLSYKRKEIIILIFFGNPL